MDLNKLTQAEKIIGGSGVALLLISFFPWFGVGANGESFNHNGWDNGLSLLGVLVAIVMVAQVALSRFSAVKLPKIGMSWGQVHMILGAVCGGLILLQLLVGDEILGFDLDRKFGVFLGLVAAAGLAYGGFLRSKEPEPAT